MRIFYMYNSTLSVCPPRINELKLNLRSKSCSSYITLLYTSFANLKAQIWTAFLKRLSIITKQSFLIRLSLVITKVINPK